MSRHVDHGNATGIDMIKKPNIQIEELRELFSYNPDTGQLVYLPRSPKHFVKFGRMTPEKISNRWNTSWANKPATSVDGNGYIQVWVSGRVLAGHRVAWALHHGEWPILEIDHINMKRTDNRIQNLRLATRSQNMYNSRGTGKKHPKGVWKQRHGGFYARISCRGKRIFLGSYETADEAHAAYSKAAQELHKEYARTK